MLFTCDPWGSFCATLVIQWGPERLETFTKAREFVQNPRYIQDRQDAIEALDLFAIDQPIARLIERFSLLPQCFTLQCCYGHFSLRPGQDDHSLDRLASSEHPTVTYRIAYLAFCIENSPQGRSLRRSLELVPELDRDCVQFGSADWFWSQYRNSYALQVEPARFMNKDYAVIERSEALRIEKIRDSFFIRLQELVDEHLAETSRR